MKNHYLQIFELVLEIHTENDKKKKWRGAVEL